MNPEEYQLESYWDERTRLGKAQNNEADVIFEDPRFAVMTERANAVLKLIRPDWTVLDACCGYGRFAKQISHKKYTGLDFSGEMVKWAREKNPDHKFIKGSIHDHKDKYDCVVEINSGKCMMGSNENRGGIEGILTRLARKCIMIIEVDYIYVKFTSNSHIP